MTNGLRLDYDRLCALLGKSWPYVTPQFFYEEMDLFDAAKLIPFVDPREYDACWIGRRTNKKSLDKAVADGVIRRR